MDDLGGKNHLFLVQHPYMVKNGLVQPPPSSICCSNLHNSRLNSTEILAFPDSNFHFGMCSTLNPANPMKTTTRDPQGNLSELASDAARSEIPPPWVSCCQERCNKKHGFWVGKKNHGNRNPYNHGNLRYPRQEIRPY